MAAAQSLQAMKRSMVFNMADTINLVIKLFKYFNGSSFYMIFFFSSLLYLFLTEEKKPVKIMLLYFSILITGLFLFPFFAYLIIKILDQEIYYRTMWLLPITVVVPYAVTKLIFGQKDLKRKIAVFIMCVVCLGYGGSFVYTHSNFTKAENAYHLPQDVIDICDYIKKPDWVVKAAFPEEMVTFVRQYTSTIELAYGREMLLTESNYNLIYYAMLKDEIDVSELVPLLRAENCTYLILSEDKILSENMENYNFTLLNTIDGYWIYMDNEDR